jgi:ubiquinone biosynthesis protein
MIQIKKVVKFTHTHRNFKRYLEIIHVFIKYGFGGLASVMHLDIALKRLSKACKNKDVRTDKACIGDPKEVRMRKALEGLGPTFIKLGQILSTRTDLIPAEFATEFAKLQDNAPHFPHEDACRIIEEELGAKAVDIFDSFNHEPLAAASIGQVYRAVYKGEEVVVKVQRPNIEKIIEIDLEIMLHLANLLEKHIEEVSVFKPSAIIEEFAKSISKEIDFEIEAKQTKRFLKNIKDNPNIYAPRIYDELTTSRVMVSEFIDGINPENIEELEKLDCDLVLLAENSVDSILKQIFEYGFFHADPHPGNILIMPNNIVCFIDFGMVGKVSPMQKQYFASLILNITKKKSDKIVDILLKLTHHEREPDRELLQRDMYDIIDEYLLHSLKELDFGKFLSAQMEIFARHKLRLKAEIFLLLKSLVSLEKTGRVLAPDVNIIEKAAPYVKKIYLKRFAPEQFLANLVDPVNDLMLLASELPDDVRVLLKNARTGKFSMDINYVGLDKLRKTLSVVSSRIAFSILLAALIIGHAMLLSKPLGTVSRYVKTVGWFGFTVTIILSFCFLISFFKNKNK